MRKGMVVSILIVCFAMLSGCATYDDIEALQMQIDDLKQDVAIKTDNINKDQDRQNDQLASIQKAAAKAKQDQAKVNSEFRAKHAETDSAIKMINETLENHAAAMTKIEEDHARDMAKIEEKHASDMAKVDEAFQKQAQMNAEFNNSINAIEEVLAEQEKINSKVNIQLTNHEQTLGKVKVAMREHAAAITKLHGGVIFSKNRIKKIEDSLREQDEKTSLHSAEIASSKARLVKAEDTIDDLTKGLSETKIKMIEMMESMMGDQK